MLAGHSHNYERLEVSQFPYIVNGAGGASLHLMGAPVAGSQVRIDDKHGAILATADEGQLTFEFYSAADRILRDRLTLQHPKLRIIHLGNTVEVSWPTNRAASFRLETRWASTSWMEVSQAPVVRGTNQIVILTPVAAGQLFRLHKP